MEPGKGPLDQPPVDAEAGVVPGAAPCDGGHDAAGADLLAVAVVFVAAVCVERHRFAAGPADPAADGRDGIQQRQELGDVVAVQVLL
ncbi:hypothetical protein GCM10010345_91710 [Streptomyces canarius]|uniref:Uncharacterized protein n=1 Tax=Streptomyces canarius TaxID=285453 RepID=A0ABQ3DB80_9ACTN|nr:hypothetical protein GCM10010345_91710 [Streptomyces canarius]